MAYRILYLDDEEANTIQPFIDRVQNETEDFIIDLSHPGKYSNNLDALFKELSNYDALILDWVLNQYSDENDIRFPFRASSLAQEVRTRTTGGEISGIPIILWSMAERIRQSYDRTAHDLFDLQVLKGEITESAPKLRIQIKSLIDGYRQINESLSQNNSSYTLLGIDEADLDIRLVSEINSFKVVHEVALFIRRELLERPGPLIDDERLGAILGIDIPASNNWEDLLNSFPADTKYDGPFASGWLRWWRRSIENWWHETTKQERNFNYFNAQKRVDLISKATQLTGIVAAKPISLKYHSYFETICEISKRPLDPIDGVLIDESDPKPWQERRYISMDEAIELGRNQGQQEFRPHPTELERVKEIRREKMRDAQ